MDADTICKDTTIVIYETLYGFLEEDSIYYDTQISLKEQGIFMLGYYQQKNDITRRIKEYKANQEVSE